MQRRRQVLSYSDALAAPSGDVDLEAPLPSLQTNTASFIVSQSSQPTASYDDGPPSYAIAWPQHPFPPLPPPPPPRRIAPTKSTHQSTLGHQFPPLATYPQPLRPYPRSQPQHQQHQHHTPYNPPLPGPTSLPRYSGPPPPFSTLHQTDHSYHMLAPFPYSSAPLGEASTSSTILPPFNPWPSPRPSPKAPVPSTAPAQSRDGFPEAFHKQRPVSASYTLRKPKIFPPQASRVVIDDCDASSDENASEGEGDDNDDDDYSRVVMREIRRSIQSKTIEEVTALWKKSQGLSSSSGTSSPAQLSSTSALGENSDYEKKQAEIKVMMEKIRKLEQARKKVKTEVKSREILTQTEGHTPPSVGEEHLKAIAPPALEDEEGVMVMAAVPIEYGGVALSPAQKIAESTERVASSSSSASSPSSIEASPQPANQILTPRPLTPPIQKSSGELEEGEWVEDPSSSSASLDNAPERKLILDPQLAEQKRKLLESMKRRAGKSRWVEKSDLSPSSEAIDLKRKAEKVEMGDDSATSLVNDTSPGSTAKAGSPSAKGQGQSSAGKVKSSKQLKRQRKKARKRASAAAGEKGSRGSVEDEAGQIKTLEESGEEERQAKRQRQEESLKQKETKTSSTVPGLHIGLSTPALTEQWLAETKKRWPTGKVVQEKK